ncbi:hypothetical protein Fmac_013158 [Flemingia macrophylla]|uniref:Uncharacterized protein n=1 Tax=Flemingia macrophylla TaxID=520843 RepID=A0ABD1MSC0_9FABA
MEVPSVSNCHIPQAPPHMRLDTNVLISTLCRSHSPRIATLQLHLLAERRCRGYAVYASRQNPSIPTSGFIAERRRMWRFDMISWRWKWVSRIISLYLLSLSLVAVASDFPTPSTYACEDITNYYSPMKNSRLRGETLKKQLNSLIAPHRSLSYREVWGALKVLDAADVDNPQASPGVVEIYSLRVVPKWLSGKPQGWNREHLWPRSYGLTNGPSLTDLHNIRPADVNANKEAALDTETDKERWAPPMQVVRGDIARALMYMAVCYGFQQPGGSPGLLLSDTPKVENKEMGLLSTLLKWNEVDPPSREEKLRNERICKFYQHNRNPFVDHPEYANLIWKQAVSSPLAVLCALWS